MVKATILVVDEAKILREVLKEYLRHSPVRVVTATACEEVLELARRERPGLIVMDAHAPVMDGLTCCALIKGDHALALTPVVLTGCSADPALVEMCRWAGCDGFLPKPVLRRDFLNLLRSFLPAVERRKPRIHCRVPLSAKADGVILTGGWEDSTWQRTGTFRRTPRLSCRSSCRPTLPCRR